MTHSTMTPDEFAEAMAAIARNPDTVDRHEDADDLMCEVLTKMGYREGVRIFVNMEKWYA